MRAALLLVPLLFSAAPLVAQPAPDAPVGRHVAYLLESARTGFAGLRGAPVYGAESPVAPSGWGSRHVMRVGGADARSTIRANPRWNVMHVTEIPVAGTRATADSLLARLAAEVAAVVPAGWQRLETNGRQRFVGFMECGSAGREVTMQTSLPFQQPGITLIVYTFDSPCPASTSTAPRPAG